MTHLNHRSALAHSKGLTLIELMISITIGLVLMIAITSAYLGSAAASSVAEAQGRMNEDAQAAIGILSQQIRMAGDNPRRPDYGAGTRSNPAFGTGSFVVKGCEGGFSNAASNTLGIGALTCGTGTSDAIAISYEADVNNTTPNGTIPTDCLGRSLSSTTGFGQVQIWNGTLPAVLNMTPTNVPFYVAENLYYVKKSGSGAPNLYCKGNGNLSGEQPLVENIEDLQIQYGTSGANTTTVAGYLSADVVETEGTILAPLGTSALRWQRVMTVRLCVLVRSEANVAVNAESTAYVPCFGATNASVTPNPADLRLRKAYYTTVVLRNRMPVN